MKVALVHDYLTQRGGAERVFLSMCRAFPDAEVYTSLYEPSLTFPDFKQIEIQTTPLNRFKLLRRHHRLALPLLASAFTRVEIDADVTICSSSGWAHGVRARGSKIVYCHNPARWLYQTGEYAGQGGLAAKAVLRVARAPLRRWDRRAARSADAYLVNSGVVRKRVRAAYGIEAVVVDPPVTIDANGLRAPVQSLNEGFFLCVSRLLPYKNVGAIVQAFSLLPGERLVVAGVGPLESELRSLSPSNVRLVGTVSDAELRWLYHNCQGLIAASREDFGLTPVEAMAFGKRSAALRWGGFEETVVEGETGVFFDEAQGPAIAEAVRRLQALTSLPARLAERASAYAESVFHERLQAAVFDVVAHATA